MSAAQITAEPPGHPQDAIATSTAGIDPPDAVTKPSPLSAYTEPELTGYRRELERAIAFFDRKDPVPPARAQLQASLEAVLAEQLARAQTREEK